MKIRKHPSILIINPPSFDGFKYIKEGRCESRKGGQLTPPITLAIISALLSEKGYKNELFDFMADQTGFSKIISKRYDLAFINTSAQTYEFDKKTASLLKENNCLTCAIGVFPTALPEHVLENFDVAIVGEPEYAALEIVQNYPRLEKVRGISYKKKGIVVSRIGIHEDIDSLPMPNRASLPIDKYINPRTGKKFTALKIERGCPYNCSFCTSTFYHGAKARYRNVEKVIDELKICKERYGITDFMFLADTFTINQDYVMNLCKRIVDERLKITWSTNSRVDTFNIELGNAMKKAGCWLISFGVESGSERILHENSKKIKINQAIEAAKTSRKAGIISIM